MKKRLVRLLLCILILIAGIIIVYHLKYAGNEQTLYGSEGLEKALDNDLVFSDQENASWQLIANAESPEEAEEIATMYQMTLLEYKDGMALYETEENPMVVIRRGQEQGYPQLWLNSEREAY